MPLEDELLARARRPGEEALRLHPLYHGKIQTAAKCAIRDASDFAIWYSPGVAAPCRAIAAQPELVYEHTGKGDTIAVVSDCSRVLGLGNIGPEAGLPVMEGKALLFKFLGGVDAVPLCLRTQEAAELVRTVEIVAPAFGGINLEDIESPKCFRVLEELRARLDIPVWHDDQQGTATVLLAGLQGALEVVGKRLRDVRLALIGTGAANIAVYRLLRKAGVSGQQIVACDSRGTLHRGRVDLAERQHELAEKWRLCGETNPDSIEGGIDQALRGADVCVAFSASGPGIIRPDWVRGMARDAIVFACANPIPEIWPWEAAEAGARVVATGRSDFPNQVNNSLGFPGIFRGALDVRARTISDDMALAAAHELYAFARARGLGAERIVPRMDEWEVYPRVAAATGQAAVAQGLARRPRPREELLESARAAIVRSRRTADLLLREGIIARP